MTDTTTIPSPAIEGAGTPDAQWQAWPGLSQIKPVSASELLTPRHKRVIVIAPHPDDEVLGCGGLLQLAAAREIPILLLAVTDGEASHPGSLVWPPARLANERPVETENALRTLGLKNFSIVRCRLPDSNVSAHSGAYSSVLQQWIEDHIGPEDLVVTTWRKDGHPDHEATGCAAASACFNQGAQLLETPIWTWHWAQPADSRVPWQRARKLLLPFDLIQRKQQAVSCYSSQLEPDPGTGRPAILTTTTLQRLLHPYEIYFL